MISKHFLKLYLSIILLLNLIPYNLLAQNTNLDSLKVIGDSLEISILNKDTTYIVELFDTELFSYRFHENDSTLATATKDSTFFDMLNEEFNIMRSITKQIFDTGYYNLINYYTIDNQYYLVYRLYNDGSINYHEYLLVKENNKFRIVDIFVFFTGEYFSKTLYNIFHETLEGYMGAGEMTTEQQSDIFGLKLMQIHIKNGDYQYGLNQYYRLSEKKRVTKQLMLYRILITQNLTNEEYSLALHDYKKLFPDDPSLYLLSIDGFIIQERYSEALLSIDTLNTIIGGDDFLDFYRANIYYMNGDLQNAELKYASLINNYPDFYMGYENLLYLYVEQEKNGQAVSVLENITRKFDYPKNQLIIEIETDLKKFSKSREFKQWKKYD